MSHRQKIELGEKKKRILLVGARGVYAQLAERKYYFAQLKASRTEAKRALNLSIDATSTLTCGKGRNSICGPIKVISVPG